MNVVVLGGTGFLGRNLQKVKPEWLYVGRSESWQDGHFFSTLELGVDLTDREDVDSFFSIIGSEDVDAVINLAGNVGGIKYNSENNLKLMRDNFLICVNVIDVCMDHGIPKVLTALSTCAFPSKAETYPMHATDMFSGLPPASNSGYAMAKRCAQIATKDARRRGYDYRTFTPTNLYGPYDKFGENSHFVAALIDKVLDAEDGGTIELYGDGKPLRQQLYVEDMAQLLPRIIKEDASSDTLLVAPPENLSIDEMAKKAVEISGKNLTIEYIGGYNGQYRKDVSSETLKKKFPDFTFTSFEDGLRATMEWRKNEKKK